jgi:hypothetical protein
LKSFDEEDTRIRNEFPYHGPERDAAVTAINAKREAYWASPEYQDYVDLNTEHNALENIKPVPEAPLEKSWPEFLFRVALRNAVLSGKQWFGRTSFLYPG